MIVNVICQRDKEGHERPVQFSLGERVIRIADILDAWPGRGYAYVKLRGDNGHTYILRYDERVDRWELWMFKKGMLTP